jgi:hypothetical protein
MPATVEAFFACTIAPGQVPRIAIGPTIGVMSPTERVPGLLHLHVALAALGGITEGAITIAHVTSIAGHSTRRSVVTPKAGSEDHIILPWFVTISRVKGVLVSRCAWDYGLGFMDQGFTGCLGTAELEELWIFVWIDYLYSSMDNQELYIVGEDRDVSGDTIVKSSHDQGPSRVTENPSSGPLAQRQGLNSQIYEVVSPKGPIIHTSQPYKPVQKSCSAAASKP